MLSTLLTISLKCAQEQLKIKQIWKMFIQSKVDFLSFEKAKEETVAENL
jgi:hypothetical protein